MTLEVNAQASCPLVDVILPTGMSMNKCQCPVLICQYQGMTLNH